MIRDNVRADLYAYIDQIRTRPGMYIGGRSISLMFYHLEGFAAACRWKSLEEQLDPPWHDFHEYVRSKTDFAESTSGWSNMLLAFSGNDEAKALEVFFEFFDDFRAKAKV